MNHTLKTNNRSKRKTPAEEAQQEAGFRQEALLERTVAEYQSTVDAEKLIE